MNKETARVNPLKREESKLNIDYGICPHRGCGNPMQHAIVKDGIPVFVCIAHNVVLPRLDYDKNE
jgi:hypothetical protein